MGQEILKIEDAPTGTFTPTGPLEPFELKLGKVIDLSKLCPGDLILVSSVKLTVVGGAIRKVQAQVYQGEHARWEHAAIYIGKGFICEATRQGVAMATLSKYMVNHVIRARRDNTLSLQQQYEIAIHALTRQNATYSYLEIGKLWYKATFGLKKSAGQNMDKLGYYFPARATICSQLYGECYLEVANKLLNNLRDGTVTPAGLSSSKLLTDVKLNWLAIAVATDSEQAL